MKLIRNFVLSKKLDIDYKQLTDRYFFVRSFGCLDNFFYATSRHEQAWEFFLHVTRFELLSVNDNAVIYRVHIFENVKRVIFLTITNLWLANLISYKTKYA